MKKQISLSISGLAVIAFALLVGFLWPTVSRIPWWTEKDWWTFGYWLIFVEMFVKLLGLPCLCAFVCCIGLMLWHRKQARS